MKEGSQGWNEEEQRVHIESRVLSKIATISFTVSFFFHHPMPATQFSCKSPS